MKTSLKHGSGYLEIDHRDSPGITQAEVAHMPNAIAVGKGQHLERDIQQCTHCQRGVVLQPLRTRDRGYCPKCDHYVCDDCETIRVKTGDCVPYLKLLDKAQAISEKYINQPDHPAILLTDKL